MSEAVTGSLNPESLPTFPSNFSTIPLDHGNMDLEKPGKRHELEALRIIQRRVETLLVDMSWSNVAVQ